MAVVELRMIDGWMGDQEGQDGPSFEKRKLLIAENRRTSTHKEPLIN